jgi:hypothetical protein
MRRSLGRALELVLPVLASIVFVVLWVYVALVAFTGSTLPADTWAWMSSLGPLPTVVVWIALLPLGVFLWAWQADLEPLAMGAVMLLLAGWTWIAWAGLARIVWRRAAGAAGSG